MITMDIKAPYEANHIESTTHIEISLFGDTYTVKDRIKELGFYWDGGQWYYLVTREWFKANGYNFARSIALEFGIKKNGLNVIGEQAKIAMRTMDK